MKKDIFKWHDWDPEHKESDESNHIPWEFVDDNQESKNSNNRSKDETIIRPKNSRSNTYNNRTHSGTIVSSQHKDSKKQEKPSDNRVSKLETPGGSGIFFLFWSHDGK